MEVGFWGCEGGFWCFGWCAVLVNIGLIWYGGAREMRDLLFLVYFC